MTSSKYSSEAVWKMGKMYGRKCFQTSVTWIVGGIQWCDWPLCLLGVLLQQKLLFVLWLPHKLSLPACCLAYCLPHTNTCTHTHVECTHAHTHTSMMLARCWLFCCCEMKLTPKWWSSAIALKEFQNRKTSKSSARLWWSKGVLFWSDNGCWHVSPLGLWTERAANYPSCNGPFWALYISLVCQLHQREEKEMRIFLLLFYSFFISKQDPVNAFFFVLVAKALP